MPFLLSQFANLQHAVASLKFLLNIETFNNIMQRAFTTDTDVYMSDTMGIRKPCPQLKLGAPK
jgi:hypothetical protein